MSGDSGRYIPPSNGGGVVNDDVCSKLRFETQVSNVDPDVLEDIDVDFVVDIGLIQENGVETVAVFYGDRILGGIGRDGARLKACLENGFPFVGLVRSIEFGVVRIFVQPNE